MTTEQKLIAYAEWYIGQKEKKNNSGFQSAAFEKEMRSAGWYTGGPWCAFFVLMVLRKVLTGKDLVQLNKQFNGSARQTALKVQGANYFQTGTTPEPGAVVIFLNGVGPSGHMAIVKSVSQKTNTMTCIEGNTNATGSSEGDQVLAKPRTITRPFKEKGLNVYLYVYLRAKEDE